MPETNNTLLWIITAICALFFVSGAVGNLCCSIRQITKRKNDSLVPIIGGLAGMIALLIIPLDGWRRYWWIPLFADLGCVPILIWTFVWWVFIWPRIKHRYPQVPPPTQDDAPNE